jgi:hypothetical protein
MGGLNAEFPSQVKIRIEDKWLDDYRDVDNACVDVRDLDSTNVGRRMRPRGILIGLNRVDATATTATVKGVLWDENKAQADTFTLAIGVVHPLAFRFIYANGTTGRWIKVLG